MNNSRHNGSFSVGDSPVKGIHRRNMTELPQTTKSGQGSTTNVRDLRASISGDRQNAHLNRTINAGPKYSLTGDQMVDLTLGRNGFGIDTY